jgi:hypothetical protein
MTKGLLAGCLATMALGCVDQPATSSTVGLSFEEFKARTYQEPGTGLYILDWDTPISGDAALRELWAATQQGALAVYRVNGQDVIWNATQKRNLTYCVSNSFGGNKQQVVDAMRAASDNGWEKFADVDFVYVPAQDGNCNNQNPNVVFDVNPVNAGGQYLMRAFFPNSPRNERNVLIDNTAFQPGGTGGVPFANIVAHELGHTLGFRHEHIRPEANAQPCFEDNQYRGVTPYDAASVMHYPQCNGTSQNLAFTQRDQQGVAMLYGAPVNNPSPSAQVTAPEDGATVAPSFVVEAAIVDTDLAKAELFVDGRLTQTLTAPPFTFQVTNLSAGPHELQVRATDQAGQTTTRTLTVTVANSGGGNGSGGGGTGEGDEGQGNGLGAEVSGGCDAGGGSAGLLVALLGLARRRPRGRESRPRRGA